MNVKVTKYKVSPNSTPIQFKRVTQDDFMFGQFHKGVGKLSPNKKGYITQSLFDAVDFERSDTTIVNVGVGQGKTSAAYKIIEHFAKKGGYVVIVVSPFKKLVRRDYDYLSKLPYKVSNYEMAETEKANISSVTDSDIHVVTINTLLHNPGEDNLQMTSAKLNYIKGIKEYCHKKKKKVVFIFDEIHAGIHTYKQMYIFNLLKWKNYTHKCFVLSATFTEASMVATEFIGRLTNDKFKIYEAPRVKLPTQSDLYLYLTSEDYSGRDMTLLSPLAEIVEKEAKAGNKVHILTAYKEWAKKLTDENSKLKLAQLVQEKLDYQLITGDEDDLDFDEQKSNIGTVFSTGVNIESGKDALVIIMPSGKGKKEGSTRVGGIFTDGSVPIIQAVARLRGKGSIYIFLPYDEQLIKSTYTPGEDKSEKFLEDILKGKVQHVTYEQQFDKLEDFYKKERADIETEVAEMDEENKKRDEEGLLAMKASIKYPELKQFMLDSGDYFLANRYESFGKNFSPYLLWAAFNNQLANTTLKELYWVAKNVEQLVLTDAKMSDELRTFYGGVEMIKKRINGLYFDEAFSKLIKALSSRETEDGEYVKVELVHKGKVITDNSKYPAQAIKAIVQLLYQTYLSSEDIMTPPDYFLSRIKAGKDKQAEGLALSNLEDAYVKLSSVISQMVGYADKNNRTLSPDFITDKLLGELAQVAVTIQNEDTIVRRRAFEFVRLSSAQIEEAEEFIYKNKATDTFKKDLKKRLFLELYDTFLDTQFAGKGARKVTGILPSPIESVFSKPFKA